MNRRQRRGTLGSPPGPCLLRPPGPFGVRAQRAAPVHRSGVAPLGQSSRLQSKRWRQAASTAGSGCAGPPSKACSPASLQAAGAVLTPTHRPGPAHGINQNSLGVSTQLPKNQAPLTPARDLLVILTSFQGLPVFFFLLSH